MKTGTDVLGNDKYDTELFKTSEGRFSSWSATEVALDTRNVTTNNRKLITKALKADIMQATAVLIDGKYHDITEVKGDEYNRWRIIVVNQFGRDRL